MPAPLSINPAEVDVANLDLSDGTTMLDLRYAAIGEGRWLPPLHYAKRRDIPRVACIITDHLALYEQIEELRRISGDESYEIVYDRATTTDAIQAGHHLYRVKRGGVPSEDVLALQISLKIDMNLPWHPENAQWPAKFPLIQWFKENDKSRLPGDPAQIDARLTREGIAYNKSVQASINKGYDAVNEEFRKDLDTYVVKNRNGVGTRLGRRHRHK